jgi:hypothetical protein
MSRHWRVAACVVSLAVAWTANAQTSSTESTTVKKTVKSGTIKSIDGNKVTVEEADGLHEYTVPEGFKFQTDGQDIGVADLKPGMKVGAVITEKVTTRDVTATRQIQGTVMQVAPGGIVVKDPKGELKSYNFKDPDGNDFVMVQNGKEIPLNKVKKGDKLNATVTTRYPSQLVTERSVRAKAVSPAEPAPAEVAAVAPARMPKTASPLPLVGLLAALAAGTALTLRAARRLR